MTMDAIWVKRVSSRRGQPYFFNTETGESCWENPTKTASQKRSSNEEQKCKSSHSESRVSSSSRDNCTTPKMQRLDCCKRSCHTSPNHQRISPHRESKRSLPSNKSHSESRVSSSSIDNYTTQKMHRQDSCKRSCHTSPNPQSISPCRGSKRSLSSRSNTSHSESRVSSSSRDICTTPKMQRPNCCKRSCHTSPNPQRISPRRGSKSSLSSRSNTSHSESRVSSSSRDNCTSQTMQRQETCRRCSCKRSHHTSPMPQRTSPRRGSKRSLSPTNTEYTRTEAKRRAAPSETYKSETADLSQERDKRYSSRSEAGAACACEKHSGQSESQEGQGRCLRSHRSTRVTQNLDAISSHKRKSKKKSKKKKSKKKKCIITKNDSCEEVHITGQKDQKGQSSLSMHEPCSADNQTGKGVESTKGVLVNKGSQYEDSRVLQNSISKLETPKHSKDACKHSPEEKLSLASTSAPKIEGEKTSLAKETSIKDVNEGNKESPYEDSRVAQNSISKLETPKHSKDACKQSAEENFSLVITSAPQIEGEKTSLAKETSSESTNKGDSNDGKSETCNREGNLLLKNSSNSTVTDQTGASCHTFNSERIKNAVQTRGDLSRDEDWMEVDTQAWALEETRKTTPLEQSIGSGVQKLMSRQEIIPAAHSSSVREEMESEMEVDILSVTEGKLLVIVDTNVLINNLPFVEKIKGVTIKGLGEILLVIPWMVMQELDGLKGPSGAPASNVSVSARKALNFLHKNRGDPSIRGQSYQHFTKKTMKSYHDSNDDKILQYCLQCKKRYDKNLVVLLTNDKNLAVKALFSGIQASGYPNFTEDIRKQVALRSALSFFNDDADHEEISPDIPTCKHTPSVSVSKQKGNLPTCSSSSEVFSEINVGGLRTGKDVMSMPDELAGGGRQTMKSLPSDTRNPPSNSHLPSSDLHAGMRRTAASTPTRSPQVKGQSREREEGFTRQMLLSLEVALSVVLRQEMMEAYTDHWLEIVHKKPPWSLLDILECFKKHYVAVFGLLLGRGRDVDLSQLIFIIRKVGEGESFDLSQRVRFHSVARWLLEILSKNPKYKAVCSKSRDDLEKVYKSWQSLTQDSTRLQADDPTQADDTAQKGEKMAISRTAATQVTSHCSVQGPIRDANFQWDRGADGGSKKKCGEREVTQCGLADVVFRVLSIFEAVWILLQSHRDLIASSFQYLSAAETPEGVPGREESLSHLGLVIPLVQQLVESLQRLLLNSDSMGMALCIPVVESVRAFASTLKADIDVSIMQPEVLEQFVSVAENRERLAVGTEQLTGLLQQLREYVVTLSQF